MERADVVVVGASAAGLAATLAAARAGASVLLLEARDEVGVPEPPALVGFDFLWTFPERPTPAETRRRLLGLRVRSPADAAHALEVEAPLSVVRRAAFDQRLAAMARAAGAVVRTGVKGLRALPDRTLRAADGTEARGRVTIFADGAGSLAQAYLRPMRDPGRLAWGAALEFEHPGGDEERFLTLTPGAHAPGGRSQLNPLEGERWSHWTFYRGPREGAEARARAALRLDARARGWPEALADAARFVGVAPDPVYTLPGKLAGDGVLVAGGAAGQAGLEVGLASGDLAGRVAAQAIFSGDAGARALGEYERQWMRAHLAGYKALRRAADRLARLDDEAIDRLLAPWSGWRVPVRDVVGLWHRSPARRAEALAKFVARNPHALPLSVVAGWRALVPLPRLTAER
ncbi:MAG TPA: FAD-dependent oxidoreductase [Candidatus Thermoplasmatota archaeon]|nr:FAD-dependent oxidoreductase [Candidatus Thermoplasmatota archaeon]